MKYMNMSDTEFISTINAARQLGVAVRTVQLWVESGTLPAWKTAGGHRRIPQAAVDALLGARPAPEVAKPEPSPAPSMAAQALRILVVEDDPALRLLFELTLAGWNIPLEVESADNGYAALLRIGERQPDLLITDLNMPSMDGFTMIREIRAADHWRTLPIIAVSALAPADVAARGGLPQDVPLFGKPVPFDRLETVVRDLAARKAKAGGA
jgi:excisionase family DNA binding protein